MSRLITATLLIALATPGFPQEPVLGRLFLTPEQRAALDNARRNRMRAEAVAATAEKKPRIPPARNVTINGIVSRSDGESTIWVNGRPTEGQTDDGMHVTISPGSQSSVVVREPVKGKRVRLKVGQSADLISGRIDESYERRKVAAPPPPQELGEPKETSTGSGGRQKEATPLRTSRQDQGKEDGNADAGAKEDAAHDAGPAAEDKAAQ
jgi:hypothetical protein